MIRVIIVDDDIDAAKALKRNIDGMDGISVVEIFNNGKEAVENYIKSNPDVILMDIRMPHMDGIETSRLIKQQNPNVKILILTLFPEKDNMLKAIQTSCDGFLYKGHKAEEIISIIKDSFNGLNIFEKEVKDTFKEQLFKTDYLKKNNEDLKTLTMLTKRERDIVRLIASGKKDVEIANELFISEGYLRNLLVETREKLGLRNSKELAVWGAKMGL